MTHVLPRTLLAIALAVGANGAATTAFAQPAGAAQPSAADVKKATQTFGDGTKLFDQKKFDKALEQFKISYATVPSPNSHLYIARCMAQLGQTREAYLEFDKVVVEAEERAKSDAKYAPTRDSAKVERDELAAKLAFVTVSVKGGEGGRVTVGGVEVPPGEWGKVVVVNPGAVDVILEKPDAPPVKQSLKLGAGDRRDVQLEAAAGPATPPPKVEEPQPTTSSGNKKLRPFAYIAGGIGVAGLATFTIAGLMSQSTYSDLEDTCKGPCPPSRADDVSSGKTQQTIANIGLVVGAVGVAAGVTLFVLSTTGGSGAAAKTGEAEGTRTALVVAPGYAGLSGKF